MSEYRNSWTFVMIFVIVLPYQLWRAWLLLINMKSRTSRHFDNFEKRFWPILCPTCKSKYIYFCSESLQGISYFNTDLMIQIQLLSQVQILYWFHNKHFIFDQHISMNFKTNLIIRLLQYTSIFVLNKAHLNYIMT